MVLGGRGEGYEWSWGVGGFLMSGPNEFPAEPGYENEFPAEPGYE
jgi:hypothetical protein